VQQPHHHPGSHPHPSLTSQKTWPSPAAFWKEVDADLAGGWYGKAVAYWDAQPATDDGVLGGHADAVADADVAQSDAFLKRVLGADRVGAAAAGRLALTAADCGAGVGRVSKDLLLRFFSTVDVIEPSAHLLATAKKRLAGAVKAGGLVGAPRAFLQTGLQGWDPAPGAYDVIWVQWALLYLTDGELVGYCGVAKSGWKRGGARPSLFTSLSLSPSNPHPHAADAIAFLRRAATALKPGGALVIKENVCASGFVVDMADRSLTRSHAYMLDLGRAAGLSLLADARQRGFPAGLFGVRMYAWAPGGGGSGGGGGGRRGGV
jgi:protein N-terminal methyltransferase